MDVGSSINIYGHLFGWHVYDMLYTFVMSTGLWTIPFFIIFYSVFVYKGYGESDSYNAKNALIAMEKYVYPTLIVIAIFFTPTISINKLKMTYNDGSTTQTAGNTNTRFDGLKDSVPNSVKIPGGWYIVLFSSSAFNGVIKNLLPNQFQARDLMYDMQQVSLDDPQLQSELNDFERKCRQPAQARLNAIRSIYPDSKIAKKLNKLTEDTQKDVKGVWSAIENFMGGGTDHWKIIEKYPGNLYFMDTLYDDSLLCKTGQDPKTTDCIPKTSNPLNPPDGTDCKSWWSGSGFGLGTGIVDKLEDAFGKVPFGGIDEDMFVAAKLMTLGGQLNTGEKGVGNKEGSLWEWGEEKSAGLFINIANIVNSATNSAVRFALPVVQGIAMMLIFMLLIIFILFGRYNIAQMAGLAILLFGISFLTSIWNIIGWIDNVMLLVIHGGAVGLVERVTDIFSLEQAVWDLVIFSAYGAASFFWLRFIVTLGAAGGSAIGGFFTPAGNSASSVSQGKMLASKTQKSFKSRQNK